MSDPITTRRFFPTPAWLIFGLLVVEGLLWLSERFGWFAFNSHKGWTVLICVAVVGGAMLLMLLWFIVALVFRWRFQFSLRSLLVLTLAVAVSCSWLALEMKKAREQETAVDEIGRLYPYAVATAGASTPGVKTIEPTWLRVLLGEMYFAEVVSVHLGGTLVTDEELDLLKSLEEMRFLNLSNTRVTDMGVESLRRLTRLEELNLVNTRVTDEGVKKLQQALPNCRIEH